MLPYGADGALPISRSEQHEFIDIYVEAIRTVEDDMTSPETEFAFPQVTCYTPSISPYCCDTCIANHSRLDYVKASLFGRTQFILVHRPPQEFQLIP